MNNMSSELLKDCKISIQLMNTVSIVARASVDFRVFIVKGFIIRFDKDALWVNPPSVRSGRSKAGWIKIFWSDDAEFWTALQEKIIEAYKKDSLEIQTASIADTIDF